MSRIIYIVQGQEAVSNREDEVISTILGSCVSICLWDPEARVGSMNHLLLPETKTDALSQQSAGAASMERMVNAMMRRSAERRRLRAKLFGGSSMLSGLTEIGARNADFARSYLASEGIPCDAESTGGPLARQIRFWPASGKVKQRFVKECPELKPVRGVDNEVELF